jgi:uncharacterized protein (DUF1501 family)
MTWTRRQLGLSALAATLAPRAARAAVPASQRCFLFLHCRGGWDPTVALLPAFDAADTEDEAIAAEAGGVAFVDHPERPSVMRFFEEWGGRSCLVHGVEVRSLAHERCHRILLTGRGDAGADDWPSILAAHAAGAPVLPHLMLAGGAFNRAYGDRVVRVGDEGQLPALLSGQALDWGDERVVSRPTERLDALADAALAARLGRLSGTLPSADRRALVDDYLRALDGVAVLSDQAGGLQLAPPDLGCERDIVADAGVAFDCFSRGLSRTAMLAYDGWCAEGWDTHKDNSDQSRNFEDLFAYLGGVLADAAARPGLSGGSLLDDVTVVVFSEMGRAPRTNAWGGKDHWTYTSVLLAGAGVRGGQVIGGVDGSYRGRPVDLGTGALSGDTTPLVASHIGATLLALGGVDPAAYVSQAPLTAAMAGA